MNATVNIMLNPTRTNSDETRTVSLRLTINRKRVYYSLGYKAKVKDWSTKYSRLKESYDSETYEDKNKTLKTYLNKALKIIEEIERSKKTITHSIFKRKFFNIHDVNISVLDFFDNYIEDLKQKGKIGNADNYKQSREALSRFVNKRLIKFEDIDVAFLNKWEKYLSKTCSGNGISNYMRTLRALFNRAISEDICSPDIYPFKSRMNNRGYNISKLETDTIKRALSNTDLEKLKNYKPIENSRIGDAKNLFFFSYYTMGMNAIDICLLKWSNIQDGRIRYIRSKNGKPHNIKILPPVQEIMDYYSQFNFGTDYVLPALKEEYKSKDKKKKMIKSYIRVTNTYLKKLGKLAEVSNPHQLTTYVARHTWATTLKRNGASTSLISEAMHHSDEKTTQIYLDSFENDIVDEMNEKLL